MTALQPRAHSVALETNVMSLLTPDAGSPNLTRSDEDTVRVLLISHHTEDDALLRRILEGPKWLVWTARTLADAIRLLKQNAFSVAVCEGDLLDGTWRDFLDLAARLEHGPEVIVASRLADASLWAEALNIGAYDVLSKPFSAKEILHVVGCALQMRGLVLLDLTSRGAVA